MTIFRLKLIRWKYVLPRLAIALAIVSGFRFGLDPLLKWVLVAGCESAVGAKVELAAVETSLADGTLELHELTVANPNAALRNLFEAEQTQLQINMNALYRHQLVVDSGLLRGVQLGTPRTTSGLLEKPSKETADEPSLLAPWAKSADEFVGAWLGQLDDRLSKDLTAELKTPQLAKELEERWPQQYESLNAQVKSLRAQAKQLEQGFREMRKNPLRHITELQSMRTQLITAQKELASLQQQIGQLPLQAEADRQTLLLARQADEKFIRQQLRITDLDQDGLTQTLLGKPAAQGVASALDWLAWARKKVPSGKAKPPAGRSRGTNVLYSPRQPRFLVKQLQLEATAEWAGQSLVLTGGLQNASSEPQLLSEPTRLEFKGTGAAQVDVVATLDRRGEQDLDHLVIVCHDIVLPGQTLGDVDKLALSIGPSLASLNIDLTLDDTQLSGELALGQQSVRLKPLQSAMRSRHLVAAIEQALGAIQQWEATVEIAGTLTKPQLKIESDLGGQVARGMQTALRQLVKRRGDELLAETQQKVEAQMQRLQEIRSQAEQELLAKLGEGQELFGQLASLSGDSKSELPIPSLSKSLRTNLLQK